MKVGRLRWWWLQARRIVLVPTEATVDAGLGGEPLGCVALKPTVVVPVALSNGPMTASFHDVYRGPSIGSALLLGVRRDGWARYKCSCPLAGRVASGDWRNRGDGLELAAIALRDPSRAYSARGLIAEPR